MASTTKICRWPKIFLYGDSITQRGFSADGCWTALLSDHVIRRCDVINRGFSGYNVSWCKILLPHVLDKATAAETAALTIFLGANDSNDGSINPRQHVPLDKYKEGLCDMVQFAMDQGVSREKIILISPPAVYVPDWVEFCKAKGDTPAHDNKVRGQYAQACMDVADKMGTKKVDMYAEMMKDEDFQKYLCDGLHFSSQGSQLLFDLLKPIIDDLTSHLTEMLFPCWDKVDLDNVEGSIQNF